MVKNKVSAYLASYLEPNLQFLLMGMVSGSYKCKDIKFYATSENNSTSNTKDFGNNAYDSHQSSQ